MPSLQAKSQFIHMHDLAIRLQLIPRPPHTFDTLYGCAIYHGCNLPLDQRDLKHNTCLTLVKRPCPISSPPDATSTEPSGYTCTLAAIAGGEQSNLQEGSGE